jgi:hypothetical protein
MEALSWKFENKIYATFYVTALAFVAGLYPYADFTH